MRYLADDMNALDWDTVRDELSNVKDYDSDLSERVRHKLFSDASIVSDCGITNSADCEIENENVVESSSCESTESVQRSLRVMQRFNGFDLSKFRCSEPIVDESNRVVKDSTLIRVLIIN